MQRTRIVQACILLVFAACLGVIALLRSGSFDDPPHTAKSAMEKFRDDPNYGAAERVRAYITDAYAWERNAMPPSPEIEQKMRAELQSRLAGGSSQADTKLRDMLQERGRALVNSSKAQLESLAALAAIHWVGDAWQEEASLLSNPPKHDPEQELITSLKPNDDGSVEVTTQCMGESRVYRVELVASQWRIRKYERRVDPR